MEIKKLGIWKKALELLKPQTNHCLLCFEEFHPNIISNITKEPQILCNKCLKTLKPKFLNYEINGVKGLAIFEYDEVMKKLIYQYKGCSDYELYPLFLHLYKNELGLRYKDYILIPMPSSINDINDRGFNHVEEVFKILNLEIMPVLIKIDDFKQHQKNSEERKEIINHMKVKDSISLQGKKVLLVDDITTTGSTLKAAIELIRKLNPKSMRILTICKREK